MELFDIVDENGIPTGKTVERSRAHAEGIRHRTAHIWIVKKENNRTYVLLQKRALNKDCFPGRFDTSSAGHVKAGDEPLHSALRELQEELGIEAAEEDLKFLDTFLVSYVKEFHGKMFKDNELAFVYVYTKPVDISRLTLQTEEVETVEWFDIEEVYEQCRRHNQKFCVPMDGLKLVRAYCKGAGR